jgi:hypothetical protein
MYIAHQFQTLATAKKAVIARPEQVLDKPMSDESQIHDQVFA